MALSKNALSVVFSNLAKASEKQMTPERSTAYGKLAEEYWEGGSGGTDLGDLKGSLTASISGDYPQVEALAETCSDRGVKRALVWGKKVTTIQKSLIDRYLSKGEALLEEQELYICEACGFIFLGIETPEICPVCKAPSSRFSTVK